MLGATSRRCRARSRAWRIVALASAVFALVASSAVAAGITWRSGAFAGYGGNANGGVGDAAFGQWRGLPVTVATDYVLSTSWGDIENPSLIPQWSANRSVTFDLSLAMWPSSGGDFADAAAGAYNSHFVTLAKNLVAAGLGGAGIRLGWEFNGTWYPWSVTTATQAAQFGAAWRQIVGAMQAVPGAHFSYVWCPNSQVGGIDPALAYPGDAYVTDIGLDIYDYNQGGSTTPTQRWNALVNDGYGLAWQAAFAKAHGKPIAFPEWGLVDQLLTPQAGGDDDPLFIQNMFNWFGTHNTDFEDYFNADSYTSLTFYAIDGGSGMMPQAAAM
jgi:hypothetical protein